MISRRTVFTISCDQCSTPGMFARHEIGKAETTTELSLEAAALRKGWLRRQVHYTGTIAHLCPTCAKSPPEWWPEEDRTV